MVKDKVEQRKYGITLSANDKLDMTFYKNKNRIVKFALNYRTFINGKWREIYRVDNYHGFLHEQKFWISPEPIPIKNKENIPLNEILTEYSIIIKEHYEKYRSYYINAKRSDKNE